MQSFRPLVPNYPPPPIPTREAIINEGLRILQQPQNDREWLKSWIKRKQIEKQSSSNRISLSTYRQKLIQHAHLLQEYKSALNSTNHDFLSELKIQIAQSRTFIYDCDIVHDIQKQIRKRKLKRIRLRRQNEPKPLSISSDSLVDVQTAKEKSFEEKIQDIDSILKTIESLKQLRQSRQNSNAPTTTCVDNNFEEEIAEIENSCVAKIQEYKTMMEQQPPSPQIQLLNYLFNNQDRSFYESKSSSAQHFLRAHQNIRNLVQIRQAWDQYLTSQANSLENNIPYQWHEPQRPCDSNWSRYIFNKAD